MAGFGPRRPKGEIRTSSQVLREIFMAMRTRNVNLTAMADKLHCKPNMVGEWRRGEVCPGLLYTEEMAQCLGYRLVLEPIEQNGPPQ